MKFFTLQCTYLFRRCFSCFLFQKIATKGAHLKISFQMRPFAFFFSFFLSDQSVMLHRLCHAVPLDGIGYVLCVRIQNLLMFSKRNGVCAAPEHGKVVAAVAKYVCIFFLQLKLFQRIVHSCSFAAAVRNDFVYTAAAIHDIKLLLKFTVHTFYIRLCIGYDTKFIVNDSFCLRCLRESDSDSSEIGTGLLDLPKTGYLRRKINIIRSLQNHADPALL